jgi:DNA-nicking Smr family endonuclease
VSGGSRDDDDRDDAGEGSQGDGGESFRDALGDDVRPLERDRLRPEPAPRLRRPHAAESGEPVRFEIVERDGGHVDGLAPGTDRKRLVKLRRGEPAPDRRLDLHGMDAAAARRSVWRALEQAWEAGEHCLLVVHGRGLRSQDGPVLKTRLPGWLGAPPHGPRVLAFAGATRADGGPGASYVLLRRNPAPARARHVPERRKR